MRLIKGWWWNLWGTVDGDGFAKAVLFDKDFTVAAYVTHLQRFSSK